MNQIVYFFDVRKVTSSKIDMNKVITDLKIKENKMGCSLDVNRVTNSEEFIKNYYLLMGYNTLKLETRDDLSPYTRLRLLPEKDKILIFDYLSKYEFNLELLEECTDNQNPQYKSFKNKIIKQYGENGYIIDRIIHLVGVPDFLVYKIEGNKIIDLTFVEIKKELDALKFK